MQPAKATGGALTPSVKIENGPADEDAAQRALREAEGRKIGAKAAIQAADERIKRAEAKIEKARQAGAKGEVNAALDALKQAQAERKELD